MPVRAAVSSTANCSAPPARPRPAAAPTRNHTLDQSAEAGFDDLAQLAARLCQTPIALVSVVDAENWCVKASYGIAADVQPRILSFCEHAMRMPGFFSVRDALADAQFRNDPLVSGQPHIRFYSGMPLALADGTVLGAICVMDHIPRELSPDQKEGLRILGRQVVTALEYRYALAKRDQAEMERLKLERRFHAFMENSPSVAWVKEVGSWRYSYVNSVFERCFAMTSDQVLGNTDFSLWPRDVAEQVRENDLHVANTRKTVELHEAVPTPDGALHHWLVLKFYFEDEFDHAFVGGVAVDISAQKRAEEEKTRVVSELREALANVKALSGLLPICACCKKIRNNSGYWEQVESYIRTHSGAEFSHGVCPDCMETHYSDYFKDPSPTTSGPLSS